jgi:cell division protein FtsI/penicillin-binding protein 2
MAFMMDRIYRLLLLFVLIGSMIVSRLAYIQLVSGAKLATGCLDMRAQEFPMEVARGNIYDRNGIRLTNTAERYSVVVFPAIVENIPETAKRLSTQLGLSFGEVAAELSSNRQPFRLKCTVDSGRANRLNALHLTGIVAVPEEIRYGYSPLASHLIGYINDSDNKGVSGVEEIYNAVLQGSGSEYAAALVDAEEKLIPGLGYKMIRTAEGKQAGNVILTIDKAIQEKVEAVMDKTKIKGAVIILRPSTGEIVAMASRPNFDANHISDYLSSTGAPLINRAIAAYQPGSVFKLAVAAAALEYKVVKPEEVFWDAGYIDIDGVRFKGWNYGQPGSRRWLTFTDALAYSSNPIFIKVGQLLGGDRLLTFAKKLGFGQKTALHLPGEASGLLPLPDKLYQAELANLSIGQGVFEATPLQIVDMVATIANDGVKVDPYLVSRITDAQGRTIQEFLPSRGRRVFSKQTAEELRKMMCAVTRYGTGEAAFVPGVGSAGKTGSAETGQQDRNGEGICHAWFAGFTPLKSPQYAAVVFVEDGMSGGDVAAPIFSEIFKEIGSKS